jgi:hypothetical protein
VEDWPWFMTVMIPDERHCGIECSSSVVASFLYRFTGILHPVNRVIHDSKVMN